MTGSSSSANDPSKRTGGVFNPLGDVTQVPLPGYRLLHEDEHLLVLDKSCGLLTVPGIGPDKADCLMLRLQSQWPGARVVHRLDRDTSGVLVVARDAPTHRALSMQFEARETEKQYIALVAGHPPKDDGEIDLPIRKDMVNTPRHMVDFVRGRPSVTRWRVISRHDADASGGGVSALAHTRLELTPITGRSHQLRVHLLAIDHPIVGDDLYAPPEVRLACPRLCLHASRLVFTHPSTGARMDVSTPAPF